VDVQGTVLMTASVPTDPGAIAVALKPFAKTLRRVGHEAGALSPWLHPEMKTFGLPVVCLETRHVRAAMAAQRNKTDAPDALGIAHILRTGWFRHAHVKTETCYRLRLLLTRRRVPKRKFLDFENTIRHSLKAFGVRLHKVGRAGFERVVRDAVAEDRLTAELMDAMPSARAALWAQYLRLHDLVMKLVARDELCRRYMRIPGVGPVTALAFKSALDTPERFARSRDVGAHFGLTPKREQSGTSIDFDGHISRQGDKEMRTLLYEAASCPLTRSQVWTSLKAWGMKLARHRGHKRAVTAVARKLAVIMHAMWRDGTDFRFVAAPGRAADGAGECTGGGMTAPR
jgi:transposase